MIEFLQFFPSPNVLMTTNVLENNLKLKRKARNPSPTPIRKIEALSEMMGSPTKQSLFSVIDYLMQIVVIMGGKNNLDTLQKIIDLIEFSGKLSKVIQLNL